MAVINSEELEQLFIKALPFEPTAGQSGFIRHMADFIVNGSERSLFVLRGYAGTGKTSMMNVLVKVLPRLNMQVVLLAPTGRAAKVLSNYTRFPAFTVHKKIYRKKGAAEGTFAFSLQENIHRNTLFIVDEASMVGEGGGLSGGLDRRTSLLDDLFSYVNSGDNCRLVFVGDTAQLPPVGLSISPALNAQYLHKNFYEETYEYELKDVMRQVDNSGILVNATRLRIQLLQREGKFPRLDFKGYADVLKVEGMDLEEMLNRSYREVGTDGVLVICRSNKRANQYNQQIRARIRWQESDISAGDYLMAVKNNYSWLPAESKAGFIANGDMLQINKIGKRYEMHGFEFVDARLKLVDYPDEEEFSARLMLDTLKSEAPSLTQEQARKLYEAVEADYADEPSRFKRAQQIKNDPFYASLQVKFAYAITCHKAQGGQWPHIYIDLGYFTEDMLNDDFFRWLYTAFTRATEKVFLLNFRNEFFE